MVPVVGGSSPLSHPIKIHKQAVFRDWVEDSLFFTSFSFLAVSDLGTDCLFLYWSQGRTIFFIVVFIWGTGFAPYFINLLFF